jgi:hypothetical protein
VVAVLLFFFLLSGSFLWAQTNSSGESDGDALVLKLAVIGPGDELYFWWGHIGLIIEDYEANTTTFYDWGIFSFESVQFFVNFAFGRLLYYCGASPTSWNINRYIETDRDVTLYTLNLPVDKKKEVRDFAEWNVLPENRDYYYHHFKYNCVSPILDILDRATDGQFRARYGDAPGRYTLRQHVRRHTWFNPFFDWALNFLMGRSIDQPTTVWEEMFLPSEAGARALEFSYTDEAGVERELVGRVEKVNTAVKRPAVLDVPRSQWPYELVLGCVMAAVFIVLLVLKAMENPAASIVWAAGQGVLGLFFGVVGLILFFMALFTNHDYTYGNLNLLYINPLLIAAAPLGVLYIFSPWPQEKNKWALLIKLLWSYVLVAGFIVMLLRLLPPLRQMNLVTLALVMPFAAVLSFLPDCAAFVRREYLWRWFN